MPYRLFRAEEDFLGRSPTTQLSQDVQGLVFYSLGALGGFFLLALLTRRLSPANSFERFGLRVLLGVFLVTWLALILGWLARKLPAYVLLPVKRTTPSRVQPVVVLPAATPVATPVALQPEPVPPVKPSPVGPREVPPAGNLSSLTAPVATPSETAQVPGAVRIALPAPAAGTVSHVPQPEGKPIQPVAAAMASATGHQPVPDTFFGDLLDFLPPDDEDAESGSPPLDVGFFGVSSLENPDHIRSFVHLNPGPPNPGRNPTQALAAAITASLTNRERKPL